MSVARAFATMSAAGLAACTTVDKPRAGYVSAFVTAEKEGVAFDPISATRPTIAMPDAYRLQVDYIRRRVRAGDRVAGYRGGLMSEASLKARNVSIPIVGALFASGRADDGASISLCGYRKASLELKVGYLFDSAPKKGEVGTTAGRVVPIVDLPDIGYRDPDRYSAVDMVAANVSAARYVRGSVREAAGIDLDALRVTIQRDGRTIAAGLGRESLGNQWQSLRTVVSQVQASGRQVKAGDLVVTGKIGDRAWLLPGTYLADYGPLGKVHFTVVPCPR